MFYGCLYACSSRGPPDRSRYHSTETVRIGGGTPLILYCLGCINTRGTGPCVFLFQYRVPTRFKRSRAVLCCGSPQAGSRSCQILCGFHVRARARGEGLSRTRAHGGGAGRRAPPPTHATASACSGERAPRGSVAQRRKRAVPCQTRAQSTGRRARRGCGARGLDGGL